ncbi:YlxR family protein [Mycoplasma sp. Pen4]|uniref:YlxR family protein n=1 Tax=Mycoplasma sp. Pen4 TaxID=640330 RepID=UPI00165434FD|nr:YlxR family protein [Mycoplasma sp. Pen4]QNM93503.1 YlxR family protein [Mycoplasma sp. Pen4]
MHTRKCIVTQQILPVDELIRFDYNKKTNTVSLDLNKNLKGRGAYFAPSIQNWEKLVKTRCLNRAFRTNVPAETYQNLALQLKEVLYEQENK